MKQDSLYRSLESNGQTEDRLAKPPPEGPDALVAHVRVCEGLGRQRPGLLGEKVVVRDRGYAERTVDAEGIRRQVSGGRVRPPAGRGRVPAPRINCTAVLVVASLTLSAFAQSTATNRPASPAEPPAWPIGLRLPDAMVGEKAAKQKNRAADILVWVPEGARRIRAMMLCPNNSDSKIFHEHAALRKVAARHEVGIVYMRSYGTGIEYAHSKPVETPPVAPDAMLKLLNVIAAETGIAEFRHAPWITFGKSSRGEFPFRMGWIYPERTIAGITYHGEGPTWPIPSWAAKQDRSILYVCANGQEEWDGTWYRHVRPFLLNYRANNAWLPHQVVGVGVGHGNYADTHGGVGWGKPVPEGAMSVLRIWDYLAMFVDKALTLRLPGKGYPTNGPLKLRTVDPDAGYLVHPRAIETLLATKWLALREKDGEYKTIPWPDEVHPVYDTEQGAVALKLLIRKAQDVPAAERRGLLWIPDRELAEAWLKLHNIKAMDVGIP